MILLDWMGDYPDADNYLTPLLGCTQSEGNRCLAGDSALGGSFWTARGSKRSCAKATNAAAKPAWTCSMPCNGSGQWSPLFADVANQAQSLGPQQHHRPPI